MYMKIFDSIVISAKKTFLVRTIWIYMSKVFMRMFDLIVISVKKAILQSKTWTNISKVNMGAYRKKFVTNVRIARKNFSTKTNLDRHIQIFHKVLPNATKTLYQCEQCPKTFMVKYYLKNHVRMVHDKIRPHKCDICQQEFGYKRDLVSHKKSHHNIQE